MYRLVQHTAAEYHSVWENTPKFADAIQTLNMKMEAINLAAENQRIYTVGITKQRDTYKKETVDLAVKISAALMALAFDHRNMDLLAQMSIGKAKINSVANLKVLTIVDKIISNADLYSAELTEYGITSENIAALHFRRDTLSAEILSPKQAILKRKNQGIILENLINEVDRLFKVRIDTLIKVFQDTNPEFYTAFKNARKVTRVVYHNNAPNTDTAPEVDDGHDPF